MLNGMTAPTCSPLLVIAHRGASGERPEHTLEAYRLAIAQGADFIEPDLVPTRDGVLVARHENALSGSTDVADRPEFADRRTRKRIDGVWIEDWFAEDFRLDELRQLRARETRPDTRPDNAAFDGQFGIPTFAEVIALAKAESQRLGRPIGLYPETKHPTFFLHEGRHLDGERIALDISAMLLDELVASEFTNPACVYIQSFEIDNLQRLSTVLMPAAGLRLPLVFLLGDTSGRSDPTQTNFGQPFDVVWFASQGEALRPRYGALAECVPSFGAATHYGQLLTAPAMQALRRIVDGLGVWIPAALQAMPAGSDAVDRRPRVGPVPAAWLSTVRELNFAVHAYTVRDEAPYRLLDEAGLALSTEALIRRLHAAGATGVFADQPSLAVAVRDALPPTLGVLGCA